MSSNGKYDTIQAPWPYRKLVLAMLFESDWLARYGAIVRPEFMPDRREQKLVAWVNSYFETYRTTPTYAEALQAIDPAFLDEIAAHEPVDLGYTADTIMEYAQAQAMKLAILQSVEDINKGDLSKPKQRVEDALRVGTDALDNGLDLVDNARDWVYNELHGKRYPTGWGEIDHLLDGGLTPGEYGLIMGASGRGKTTALINIGYAMAGLLCATNVTHVTYEIPVEKVLKRYAARLTGIRLSHTDGEAGVDDDYIKMVHRRARLSMRGKIRVIRPDGKQVDDLKRMLDRMVMSGYQTGALIVDYPDLMRPDKRRNEFRFELADIARDLRDLGNQYGMPVWGATQAGRQAEYKQLVTLNDVAESIEKAQIADVVISICQTRDEEAIGMGRLFTAKARDAQAWKQLSVSIDFKRQSILSRGFVEDVDAGTVES